VLPKDVNQRIGQAMHMYDMLHDGDRVMIAVSGGVDSLVLMWLLDYWRRKAPIDYELLAVHLDMGFDEAGCNKSVLKEMNKSGLPILIEHTDFGSKALTAENGKSACYHCSRQRRTRLFELARERGINKIAFGHHKDDILETFFLNLLYSGNISTMVPRQELFEGDVIIIRPMAFIEKKEIMQIADTVGITPVKNPCGLDGNSKRQEVREILHSLYRSHPKAKANMFAALGNIRDGYLLAPSPDSCRQIHEDLP
jgi:tRNA 2-thiocytidine biosynthesis protein TtcA